MTELEIVQKERIESLKEIIQIKDEQLKAAKKEISELQSLVSYGRFK